MTTDTSAYDANVRQQVREAIIQLGAVSRRLDQLAAINRYPNEDVRTSVLRLCSHTAHAARVNLSLLQVNLDRPQTIAWLAALANPIPDQVVLMETNVERFARVGFITLFLFPLENLFRNLYEALPPGPRARRRPSGWGGYVDALFQRITIGQPERKRRILFAAGSIRNSLHRNGIHSQPSLSVSVNRIQYRFVTGQRVRCASWHHILNITAAVVEIVQDVILSPEIQQLAPPVVDRYVRLYLRRQSRSSN